MITTSITSLAAKPIGIGANALGRAFTARAPSVALLSSSSVISAIRGGGGAFDLDRSIVRLDAIGAYPVVAAIMMSAMLDMNMDTPKVIKEIPPNADKSTSVIIKFENIITCLFSFISTLSIAAAAYSTVVFTLVVIYSKTAIGMQLDSAFLSFFDATATVRSSAFRSFVYSMIGFIMSLSMSRFLKETGIVRWIESFTLFTVAAIGAFEYNFILGTATKLIFAAV